MPNLQLAVQILRLLDTPGIGVVKAQNILRRARRAETSSSLEDRLLRQFLTESQSEAFERNEERIRRLVESLEAKQVSLLPISDPGYPAILRARLLDKAPPLLFVIGNPALLSAPGVGFCGSRHASEKGIATAQDCSGQLAQEGLNVVSGFASGVDLAAHRTALEVGGTTTVVLAEGILHFKVKQELRDVWDAERAVIVSEFLPGLPWSVHHAMQRNRTICGLSLAMVLIEAGARGGSYEAGRAAIELGMPLFAAVYEGMPESATGNAELLAQGARRLMKSRATHRANLSPILAAIVDEKARISGRAPEAKEAQLPVFS
ncbi:MAG TPA: DNA-processing protein DprA [Thermoanaerobaculia bacterium]|nr:DNA-processing protein DprA [Thermoanaerobaculia bacterium]